MKASYDPAKRIEKSSSEIPLNNIEEERRTREKTPAKISMREKHELIKAMKRKQHDLMRSIELSNRNHTQSFLSDSKVFHKKLKNSYSGQIQIQPFTASKKHYNEGKFPHESEIKKSVVLNENLKKILETAPAVDFSKDIRKKIDAFSNNKLESTTTNLNNDETQPKVSPFLSGEAKKDEYNFMNSYTESYYLQRNNPIFQSLRPKKKDNNNSLPVKPDETYTFLSPSKKRGTDYRSPRQSSAIQQNILSRTGNFDLNAANSNTPIQQIFNTEKTIKIKGESSTIRENNFLNINNDRNCVSKSPRSRRNTSKLDSSTQKSILNTILMSNKRDINDYQNKKRHNSTRYNRSSVAMS